MRRVLALALSIILPLGIYALIRRMAFDRLSEERDQHHLASLLCAVAAGLGEHQANEIVAHLYAISKDSADRKRRLVHAVWLARRSIPAELHRKIRDLADDVYVGKVD